MKYITIFSFFIFFVSCHKDLSDCGKCFIGPMEGQPSTLLADSVSTVLIEADFNAGNLPKEQEVTFTTTNGDLFQFPFSDLSGGSKSLTFKPQSDKAVIVLRSSDIVDDQVFISFQRNNYTAHNTVRFVRACPDELFLKSNVDTISARLNQTATLEVELYRSAPNSVVSKDTRVEFAAILLDPGDMQVEFDTPVFSTGKAVATTLRSKNGVPGKVTMIATVEDPCFVGSNTVIVEVKE
ncbi:MAG: hypothetical protein AAFZ15_08595 [Bacteroidota bacterium]